MSKPARWLVAVLAVVYIGSTAFLYGRVSDTNQRLARNVNSQVANRAANVRSWCHGVNDTRDYDRAFVRQTSHGRVKYLLGDLPCKALIAKTLKSAQHH